jgi:hypothetical protein
VPEPTRLTQAGEAPLAAEEVAEMRGHLSFFRRYKDVLRLKLNAAEDLLVNGQREPSERGVCRHLLGKLDRTVVEHALDREPLRSDPAQRARMLAGAVRVTADVGILLAYLETLAHVRSHVEAAQAFSEVVGRIDFATLSAGRFARLLQVLVETFTDHERVQVLFGLLALPGVARAFDAAAGAFSPAVEDAVAPLRAVHRLAEGGGDATAPPPLVLTGMERILAAPDPVLRAYAEPLRLTLLEAALAPGAPAALGDRAAGVLLPSLARESRAYGRLALRRAAQLLARHADDRAQATLAELRRVQPAHRTAERWLHALDARRVGRVALAGEPTPGSRLLPAFWLDAQRAVWLRTAPAADAERLAGEARLHEELAVPGVASVVEHGIASGIPYVAIAAAGRPWDALDERPDLPAALALAAAGARLLHALALAGVTLPDAALARFLVTLGSTPMLVLADLDGAVRAADPSAARLAAALANALLPPDATARIPAPAGPTLATALAAPSDAATLVNALERATWHAPHAARDPAARRDRP